MELNRLLDARRGDWQELEGLLDRIEGGERLDAAAVERLCRAYRRVSSDLVRIRTRSRNPAVTAYLNHLVGRAYAAIYAGRRGGAAELWSFYAVRVPAAVRGSARAVAASALCLAAGVLVGVLAMALDRPGAREALLPPEHQLETPAGRIARLEAAGPEASLEGTGFATTFFFAHNLQVAVLAFALGVAWGVPTALVLFANGLVLGAVGAEYWASGAHARLFFFAWILPHGVPELAAVVLAGAAGLAVGGAVARPGLVAARDALAGVAPTAARLLAGTVPLFLVAALVEGSVSQLHEPHLAYGWKLLLAAVLAGLLGAWIAFGGRREAAR